MPYGFLSTLFRHRGPALLVFLTVFLAGLGYVLVKTPEYRSTAQLVVRFGDRSVPDVDRSRTTEMTPADRREIVLAHAAMLGSPDLAQATIRKVGLSRLYPGIASHPPSAWPAMDEATRVFSRKLSVDVGSQDNIITVSFLSPDKRLAAEVVGKLIGIYVGHEASVYQNPEQPFLQKEVRQAGARLAAAQAALGKFTDRWRITNYDQEITNLLKQRGDVDINLRNAQASLALAQNRAQDVARVMRGVPARQPEAASGEKYRALDEAKTQLGALKLKQSQMLATYAPGSPALATLNAGIADAEAQVRARQAELASRANSTPNTVYQNLQTDYLRNAADARSNTGPVKVLSDQLAGIDQRLKDLQANRGAYDDLVRARQIAEDTFKALSQKYEDARVKTSLNAEGISPASVISKPTLPYRPEKPRKLMILVACLACGMILAAATALLAEALNNRFSTAEQVAIFLDIPVIASIERDQRHVESSLLGYGSPS